ncbi:hypothetical protein QR680_018095 [Steinernema hermaphroditum]|uniref:V-SNARE coiled-coil homology domain-containing protein n=1 Tax=Steinernema hermaphroditum TaxID=289476 RepID=A0AA39HI66_9BILA|nr:hypothetical protein QR680_018095 [Steinernema hermaphroditum]
MDVEANVQQPNRMAELQRQVNDVKTVMSTNVERILERGERLENLDHRTEQLSQSAESFKTSARRVQRHMCRKNLKWTIICIVGAILLITVIILIILSSAGVFNGNNN